MKLFYRKSGTGPPLVILHGLYGSSDNWITIARQLEESFTVILPDQRNHGQSPHSNDHDYKSMSSDLMELVTLLRIDKFFLAGHSMGGKTAVSFAAQWPEMLNGLLIADISPFAAEYRSSEYYKEHKTILNSILSLDLTLIRSRSEADEKLKTTISSGKVRGFILKNLLRKKDGSYSWKLNARSLYNNLDKIMEPAYMLEAAEMPVTGFPVIFLKGSESGYILTEDTVEIKRVFPGAEIVEVADSGHWIHADQPDEVIRNLKRLRGTDD